jgi:hypothetical protein
MVDVNVKEETLWPNSSQNVVFEALKNSRVSFVILLIIVVGIYIGMFFLLEKNQNNDGNFSSNSSNMYIILLEIVLWVMLIVIVYVNINNYDTKNYNFQTSMKNLFNTKLNELNVNVDEPTGITASNSSNNQTNTQPQPCVSMTTTKDACLLKDESNLKEVFHFPDNDHTYQEAKELCEAYDARLATYDEIERAYNNGANWCSYGWSKEQMALFPTQKSVYNELKQIKGHEHDCGRPGINGGFFNNKDMKFGVNCYGVKPKATPKDKEYMHTTNHTPYINKNDSTYTYEKPKPHKVIASFSKDKWTKYNN